MVAKTETKLWQLIKNNTPSIYWNRLENSVNAGMPDLIGSIPEHHFFTNELKITYDNKTVKFSPHQIAWHNEKVNSGVKFITISNASLSSIKLFDHSLAVSPRPLFVDHKPLYVIDDTKDSAQWKTLIDIIKLSTA